MPEISNQTMIIAIQTVASQIQALRVALADGEADAEDYQLLEEHLQAAEDLEHAYDVATRTVLNLPPYNELVGG